MHNKHVPRLPAIASLGAALVLLASMLGSLAATPRSSSTSRPSRSTITPWIGTRPIRTILLHPWPGAAL